jgi:hypothetical protein
MGGKLGHVVATAVGGEHRNARVSAQELGELLGHIGGLIGLLGPYAATIVAFAQALAVGLAFVKANLRLENTDGFQLLVDGDGSQLDDGVLLRV